MTRYCWALVLLVAFALSMPRLVVGANAAAAHGRIVAPTPEPAVVSFSVIKASVAVRMLQRLYPRMHFLVDEGANAVIVSATPDEIAAIRLISNGIDTKSPLTPITQSITLHRVRASELRARLSSVFPQASFTALNPHTLLTRADNATLQQIASLIANIDIPDPTPTPAIVATPAMTEAVHILQARPKDVARQLAGALRGLNIHVAGQSVILAGASDVVQRGKELIAVLDAPPSGTRYTAVYRIKTLDAKSVGDLLQRSFPNASIMVDEDINSISVFATASEQRRIAEGLAQLDSTVGSVALANAGSSSGGSGPIQVYTLKYALPAVGGGSSTSAAELATMVTQALAPQAPDLHVAATANSSQLILTGSPYSIKLAKDLIGQLDVAQRLVVLDTEILEVDENTAKNLGLQVTNAVGGAFSFGTVFSEVSPTPDPSTGITPPLNKFRPLTRTPLAFAAVLNLAIQHGSARVLADPRITTLSGHTATIRAGDNIAIQLQAGGGAGTIATTQIQTFQTGVALDITPIVNSDGLITVALHPVVNSLTGILNGIPQISTRDTQTTVALKENETLVIGGLIQDNTQRTESRIPILGDLPVVGRAFRNQSLNGNRNELIISVTPHILIPGQPFVYPGPPLPAVPTPQPLPSLPAWQHFPEADSTHVRKPIAYPNPTNLNIAMPVNPGLAATSEPLASPSPTPSPSASTSALNNDNAFIYGTQPSNNVASPLDAVRIFYVKFSPTRLTYGDPVSLTAITSTNITNVTLAYNGVSVTLPQTAPGKWQATMPFTLLGEPSAITGATLSLIACRADGVQTTIAIPVSVSSRNIGSLH